MAEKFLKVEEAAACLNLAPWTVRQLVRRRELGAYRIGQGKGLLRFSRQHINDYLARRETRPMIAA